MAVCNGSFCHPVGAPPRGYFLPFYTLTFKMSADYSPSDSVVAAHNIPHMDSSGGSTSNEFDATDTEYLMSLLCFPILIGCIGIFALFFYQFIYCCFCCSCCKTVDKLKKEEVGTAPVERIQKIVLRRQHLIYMFFTVLLGIIICDQLFVSYNENFTSGVNTMGSAFDDLSNTTHVLVNATDDISYSTNLVAEQLTLASTGSCPANDPDINNMLQGLSDNAAELSDLLSPVPGSIDDGKESMKLYLIEYKNGFIFTGYALILVLAAVYLIAYFLKSRTIFRIWGALTGILILVLIITCTIIMIVVVRKSIIILLKFCCYRITA